VQLTTLYDYLHLSRWKKSVFIIRKPSTQSWLVGLGIEKELVLNDASSWTDIDGAFRDNDWWFATLSYDLKNRFEALETRMPCADGFPLVRCVCPETVLEVSDDGLLFLKGNTEMIDCVLNVPGEFSAMHLSPAMSRQEYLRAIHRVMQHLHRGDIYEVNYCQEWSSRERLEAPFARFLALNARTTAPHAAYVQYGDCFVLCGSPERFLRREGDRLFSQPIKGTIRRSADAGEDESLKEYLKNSAKDRAENVMIVDLVRNDLSRVAAKGSVQVDELFGVHTFRTVHHLISTVSARVNPEVSFSNILRATFPMGSMTGAPKVRAMQVADALEMNSRGIYSGSIGYKAPSGDFDFNVVIRALIANNAAPYVACKVGGAITVSSHPEQEYEECLLKADAVMKSLQDTTSLPLHG
jgi:para-aminobenzoate synthetase component I